MSIYLSLKEIWRNKGRFFLFSMVIALIAVLVLFTAGLGEGLASANKEYLEKLDADLLVFQEGTNYSTIESRLAYQKVKRIQRLDGLEDAGPIGFSNLKVVLPDGLVERLALFQQSGCASPGTFLVRASSRVAIRRFRGAAGL